MSLRLTKDEQTVLERHAALATKIANCPDPVEAVRFAYMENSSLREGIEDCGRMTLTRIAQVSRFMTASRHPENRSLKDRKLIENLAALPEFVKMGTTFDKLKEYLLDSTDPEVRKAKEDAIRDARLADQARHKAKEETAQ